MQIIKLPPKFFWFYLTLGSKMQAPRRNPKLFWSGSRTEYQFLFKYCSLWNVKIDYALGYGIEWEYVLLKSFISNLWWQSANSSVANKSVHSKLGPLIFLPPFSYLCAKSTHVDLVRYREQTNLKNTVE